MVGRDFLLLPDLVGRRCSFRSNPQHLYGVVLLSIMSRGLLVMVAVVAVLLIIWSIMANEYLESLLRGEEIVLEDLRKRHT